MGAEETITLGASTSARTVGRVADSPASALVIVPAADVGGTERAAQAERLCRIASATLNPILVVPVFGAMATAALCDRHGLRPSQYRCRAVCPDAARAAGHCSAGIRRYRGRPGAHPGKDGVPPPHVRLLFDALPSTVGLRADVALAPHFLKGARVATLIDFTKAFGAELLAIGRQGRVWSSVGQQAARLGATVRGLVELAPCSLLVSSGAAP